MKKLFLLAVCLIALLSFVSAGEEEGAAIKMLADWGYSDPVEGDAAIKSVSSGDGPAPIVKALNMIGYSIPHDPW